jgi:hypothetical protein
LSFLSINTHSPMNRDISAKLGQATQTKNSVLGTVGRFQGLDDKEGVDLVPGDDIVMVSRGNETSLPPTISDKIKAKLPEGWTEEGPEVKATGFARQDREGLATADVTTFAEGKETDYNYNRLPDGSEVYHGPTADGYAVVRENKANGTLFMATGEQPMLGLFQHASRSDFEAPAPVNDPANSKPQTFKEALGGVVESTHTSGSGTYIQGVHQRAAAVGNVLESIGSWFGRGKKS